VSPENARLVFLLILAGGTLVWLAAVLVHRRVWSRRPGSTPSPATSGEVEVEAAPGVVRERLVATLRGGLVGLGPVAITEARDDLVSGGLSLRTGGRRGGGRPLRFEIGLERAGEKTVATYRLDDLPGSWIRRVSALFVYLLSPAALVAIGIVIPRYVLGSPEPGVRAQAIQAMQVIHFLWPPFLFCGLTKWMRRAAAGAFRALLLNLNF
jgi:hypothetical protein